MVDICIPRIAVPARSAATARQTSRWWDLRQVPVTTTFMVLLLASAAAMRWVVADPEAVEQWASTNLVNLHNRPALAMLASAFVSSDGIPYDLAFVALACGLLERRVGGRRMLAVVVTGHVVASLVTEGAVRLSIHAHADTHAAAWQLDTGISYVMYTAIGGALLYVPRRWRPAAVAAVALYVVVPLAIAPDMTAWGHVLSLLIGLLCWPLLVRSRRTDRGPCATAARSVARTTSPGMRLGLAALGVLTVVGLVMTFAPAQLLNHGPAHAVLVSRLSPR